MSKTKVKDMMTEHPEMISPDSTLLEACQRMKEIDCGCLPVGAEDNAEGMITDRDIIIRAISEGVDPATAVVRDYMTTKLYSCKQDASLKDAAKLMNKHDVSRLTVEDENGRVVGILSFGHILRSKADSEEIAETVYYATGRIAA